MGGRLLDKAKSFSFQDGRSPLCLSVEELNSGWQVKPGTENQELSFPQVWNSRRFDLHCAFTLEKEDRHVNSLTCRIAAHQPGAGHKQIIRISLADLRMTVYCYNSFANLSN